MWHAACSLSAHAISFITDSKVRSMRARTFSLAAVVCLLAASAFAQGQQYGTVSGRVFDADHLPLPGATITVSSEALQGPRATTTDVNGVYSLPGLPPGDYTVQFQLAAMTPVERRATLPLGSSVVLD